MKNSTFWNILVYALAVVMFTLCLPLIITVFVAKFFEIVCDHIIQKVSENRLGGFLVQKREMAKAAEQAAAGTKGEVDDD